MHHPTIPFLSSSKSRVLFIFLLSVALGCSKKNDPAVSKCLYTGEVYTGGAIKVSYNSQGLADTVYATGAQPNDVGKSVLRYDNSGRLTDINNPSYHERIQYGSTDLASSVEYFSLKKDGTDSVQIETDTFTYKNSLLDRITYSFNMYERFEYDSKGNVSKQYSGLWFVGGGESETLYTHSYNYDDKVAPHAAFPFTVYEDQGFLTMDYYPVVQKHNPLTETYYRSAQDSVVASQVFTYNSDGYTTAWQGQNITYDYSCP